MTRTTPSVTHFYLLSFTSRVQFPGGFACQRGERRVGCLVIFPVVSLTCTRGCVLQPFQPSSSLSQKARPPRHTCPAPVCDLPQLVHKINVIYVYSHIYTGNTLTYTRTHIRTQRLCTHRKSYECLHGSQRPGPPCRVCYQSECVATPFYVFPSPSSG